MARFRKFVPALFLSVSRILVVCSAHGLPDRNINGLRTNSPKRFLKTGKSNPINSPLSHGMAKLTIRIRLHHVYASLSQWNRPSLSMRCSMFVCRSPPKRVEGKRRSSWTLWNDKSKWHPKSWANTNESARFSRRKTPLFRVSFGVYGLWWSVHRKSQTKSSTNRCNNSNNTSRWTSSPNRWKRCPVSLRFRRLAKVDQLRDLSFWDGFIFQVPLMALDWINWTWIQWRAVNWISKMSFVES